MGSILREISLHRTIPDSCRLSDNRTATRAVKETELVPGLSMNHDSEGNASVGKAIGKFQPGDFGV